jgi:hypothetical protein
MAAQAVVRRAVHTPLAQDVPGCGGTQFHTQDTAVHAVVHFRDLRTGLVWVWHQLQFNDTRPLNILVASLVRLNLLRLS